MMSEGTKKVLIITCGIVIVTLAILVFKSWRQQPITKKCGDGRIVEWIDPEVYILKYSGKKVEISVETKDKLKTSLGVSEEVIQQAIASTQFIDQQLRLFIGYYNARSCETDGQRMYDRLVELRSKDLPELARLNQQLSAVAQTGSKMDRSKAVENAKQVESKATQINESITAK